MRSAVPTLVLGAALAALTVPRAVRADPPAPAVSHSTGPVGVLSPGLLYSDVWGRSPSHGFGLEVSYAYHPRNTSTFNVGAFTQGQVYTDGSLRFGGGLQGGWSIFGVEVGVAHRTGTADFRASTGLHVAPYISVGFVSVALRMTIPFNDTSAGPNSGGPVLNQGPETALTVSLKFPIRTNGQLPPFGDCGCPHGGHAR